MRDVEPQPFRFQPGDLITADHLNAMLDRIERLESIVRGLTAARESDASTSTDTEVWESPPAGL